MENEKRPSHLGMPHGYDDGIAAASREESSIDLDDEVVVDDFEPIQSPAATSALIVLTRRTLEDIRVDGGIGWWRLSRANTANVKHVIVVRNRHALEGTVDEHDHNEAFLIGRVVGREYDPQTRRTLFKFDVVAHVSIPNARSEGLRNPAHYTNLDVFGINPDMLDWETLDGSMLVISKKRRQREMDRMIALLHSMDHVMESMRANLKKIMEPVGRRAVFVDGVPSYTEPLDPKYAEAAMEMYEAAVHVGAVDRSEASRVAYLDGIRDHMPFF